MKLPRFTLRDLFWLLVVAALSIKLWIAEAEAKRAIEMWGRAVENQPNPQPPMTP